MLEEMLMNVVQAMSDSLDEEQLDKLQNVLYIQFHDKKIVEEKNELQATGTDSDTAKIRLFVGCILLHPFFWTFLAQSHTILYVCQRQKRRTLGNGQ